MKRVFLSFFVCLTILSLLMGTVMFDASKPERVIKVFNNLVHTTGQFYGKPFSLLPWQKNIVSDVYGTVKPDGTRQYKTIYIELPKKNGKSEFAAGLGIYHTFFDGERNGEVYGCAADREQASIIFDVAYEMIGNIPALKKRTKPQISKKIFTDKVSGTFYKVLSADAFRKHGFNVSACIFDELHTQPNRKLWDVMTFGAGDARLQPIWIVLTTAGEDPDRESIGWEIHDWSVKVLSGEIIDPTWYPVIYGYEGDDIYNEDNWALANPSLGETIKIESVREAAAKAKENAAQERLFRWLRLNQWVTSKLTTWQSVDLFDATVGDWNRLELRGLDCFLGMDLSSTTDLTSIAFIFPPQKWLKEWRVFWENFIPRENMKERIERDKVSYDKWEAAGWLNVTEGNVVDYTKVEDKILLNSKIYKIKEVDNDPAFATMLTQRLAKKDITTVDIPQTFVQMTDPIQQIEILLNEGKMTHEPDLVARWSFGNASIAKNGSGLQKFVKEHKGKSVDRTKRIDPMIAWVCAMARAKFYKGSNDISEAILDDDWGM